MTYEGYDRRRVDDTWIYSIKVLAYIDVATGKLSTDIQKLSWLIPEKYSGDLNGFGIIEKEKIYHVVGVKSINGDKEIVISQIIDEVENDKLEKVLNEHQNPMLVESAYFGEMYTDKDMNILSGYKTTIWGETYIIIKSIVPIKTMSDWLIWAEKLEKLLENIDEWGDYVFEYVLNKFVEDAVGLQYFNNPEVAREKIRNEIKLISIIVYKGYVVRFNFGEDTYLDNYIVTVSCGIEDGFDRNDMEKKAFWHVK